MTERDAKSECDCKRRTFLVRLSLGLAAASGALIGAPVVGFVLAPLMRGREEVWRSVGKVKDFATGKTVKVTYEDPSPLPWGGVTAHTAAWLRRGEDGDFAAFSINCTHLGCPVRWLDTAGLFMCPCHGGVYYDDGTVAGGPPPKPLPRYPVRVQGDLVQIRTRPLPLAGETHPTVG